VHTGALGLGPDKLRLTILSGRDAGNQSLYGMIELGEVTSLLRLDGFSLCADTF
jgi:hypothetical protein